MPAPRSPTPSPISTSLLGRLENMSVMLRSSSSLVDRVEVTATVQLYQTGSAFGGGGGGLGFFGFGFGVGSVFSQRPKPR